MGETAVREKPVGGDRSTLSTPEMVRAALEGRKTQTRRVVKPQPTWTEYGGEDGGYWGWRPKRGEFIDSIHGDWPSCMLLFSPYEVGMRLWVREAWQTWTEFNSIPPKELDKAVGDVAYPGINYLANGNEWDARKRPAIHMPRWASRLTLEVTGVKVERVQDISEADARSEGVEPCGVMCEAPYGEIGALRCSFAKLWNRIHGEEAWERNDWVRAVTFRRIDHD